MSGDVYSTQFYAGQIPTATGVLYTVPGTATVVIRDIELYGNNATPIHVAFAAGISGLPRGYIFYANPLEPGAMLQWEGRAVISAGQQLLSITDASGGVGLISGYLLTG